MIVGLLLAAGGARRFKSQKLIAPYLGKPLVWHAAQALRSATDSMIVVVGHEADVVRSALGDVDAECIANEAWASGLSGSVRCGVAALAPDVEGVVVAVGDQPGLDANVVRRVVDAWRETGRPIVSARYQGERGHPVFFARSLFPELLQLEGDTGARTVIARDSGRVAFVDVNAPMPPDVDTVEQLASLPPLPD